MEGSDYENFIKKSQEIFAILDKERNGYLINDDLKKGFVTLNIPSSRHEALLREMISSKSNIVSKEDFDGYVERQYVKIKSLFHKLDTKGDNKLSIDELRQGLHDIDPETIYSDEAIQQIFYHLDKNKNGTIDFDEWCEFLMLFPNLNLTNVAKCWEMGVAISDPHDVYYYEIEEQLINQKKELVNIIKSFSAGALAGAISRTFTAPLDRLKILNPPGMIAGLTQIFYQDGFKGLFRGNLVNIIKSTPETAIRLTVFEKLKASLSDKTGNLSELQLFLSGATSGVVSSIAVFPMDVIKTRLAAAPTGTYLGILDAIKKIATNEGRFMPFYRGLSAQISQTIPNSGLNLMSYEVLKRIFFDENSKDEPGLLNFMLVGGTSAIFSSTLLYPFQIVTTQLIMQGMNELNVQRLGMIDIIRRIHLNEGTFGFYKGYIPAITKIVFGNAISLGVFEILKKYLGVDFRKKQFQGLSIYLLFSLFVQILQNQQEE